MPVNVVNATNRKQNRVMSVIRNLECIPKVTVRSDSINGDISNIWIHHQQQYVPDFQLQWCPGKEHFRVYIHVASTKNNKENAGYCIFVLQSGLAAAGFAWMYNFIHSHRANNKGSDI